MLAYLDDQLTSYIDKLALVVFDEFGVEVSKSAVKDYLARA